MNPEPATPVRPVSKSSGVVVPNMPKWHQRLAGRIVHILIRMVALTLRYRWIDRAGLATGEPMGSAIYCVWHNRLALSMIAYFDYVAKYSKTSGLAAMVSASRDGGFLSSILECFGVKPVRGSSSRRGAQALRELKTWAAEGYDLAITPDGPRGPCYVVQHGVIDLARLTGQAIVPVTWNANWKISLKSWDRFQIPLPFSRCEMIYEQPIRLPRDASPEQREAFRLQLERVLKGMSWD